VLSAHSNWRNLGSGVRPITSSTKGKMVSGVVGNMGGVGEEFMVQLSVIANFKKFCNRLQS
jgi:hypothetical protein